MGNSSSTETEDTNEPTTYSIKKTIIALLYSRTKSAVLTSTHSPNRQPQQKHLLQNKNISKEISNNSNSNTIIINKLDINHNITTTATTLQIVRPAPLKKLPSLTNTTATITSEGGGGSTATVTTSVVGNIVNNNNKDNHNTHHTKYISPDDSRRNKDEQQKIAAAKKKVALNQRQEQKKQEIKKKQQQCQFPITHQFNIQGYNNNNNNRNTTGTTMVKNNNDTGEPLQKKQPQAQRNNNNITNNYRVNANTNNTTQQLRTNSIDKIQQDQQISDSTTTTPLFERLQTKEIAELKSYNRILSLKNHQISTFESLLEDLETRLEQETSNRLNLEHLLESSNNTHLKERLSLEKDVDMWKTRVQVEKMKNKKLLEEVNKKDKEIHKMMQRKYDAASKSASAQQHTNNNSSQQQQQRNTNTKISNSTSQSSKLNSLGYFSQKSPQEILAASGNVKTVRERNVANSLLDFFGM